jgi:hypothetical protein
MAKTLDMPAAKESSSASRPKLSSQYWFHQHGLKTCRSGRCACLFEHLVDTPLVRAEHRLRPRQLMNQKSLFRENYHGL